MRSDTQQQSTQVHRLLKLDTLCERQLLRVVDGAGGAAHVLLPRVRPGLAAAAGRLLAAERAADLGPRRRDVDVDDSAVGSFGPDPLRLNNNE